MGKIRIEVTIKNLCNIIRSPLRYGCNSDNNASTDNLSSYDTSCSCGIIFVALRWTFLFFVDLKQSVDPKWNYYIQELV